MRIALAIAFTVAFSTLACTLEIKLDDGWFPRLAQLCDAARYGSRMTAEPICNDLAVLVQKAQAEEAAKDAAKTKQPPPPATGGN